MELEDGAIVQVETDRGRGRFRVRRGDQSFNIGIEEILRVVQQEPQGFWEAFRSRLTQGPLPVNLPALVAAAKVEGKSRPLFTWGAVDAIPYLFQYTPLFALRRSPWGRVLVADETGLGKTIEAGIVIMELLEADEADGGIRDVLVIGPVNLFAEWERKLAKHFGLQLKLISSRELLDRMEGPYGPNKEGEIHYLSMDALPSFLKLTTLKPSTLPTERHYDLIVVDEAHHFKSEETKRSRALKVLLGDPFQKDQEELRPIPKLLLLTATPLSTHLDNLQSYFTYMDPGLAQVGGMEVRKGAFRAEHLRVQRARRIALLCIRLLDHPDDGGLLLQIRRELSQFLDTCGEEEEDAEVVSAVHALLGYLDDPASASPEGLADLLLMLDPWSDQIIRNTRRGVGMSGRTRVDVKNLAVNLHPAEDRLVRSAPWRLHEHPFGQLSIRQQMSSSVPAYLFRHLLGLSDRDLASELLLDFDPEDPSPDLSKDEAVRLALLAKIRDAPAASQDLLTIPDGKYDELHRALRTFYLEEGQQGALLFTRFTATAEYLRRRVEADAQDFGGLRVFHIHGGVPRKLRTAIITSAMNCKEKFLMILTEVGQEGVDLQFATGVFHYDLPWNPMRIIQRNGRVHRIGQKADRIFLHTFYVNGTVDDDISRAIAERMDLVCKTFGDLPEGLVGLDPGQDLARIIGDRVKLEVYTGLHGITSKDDLDGRLAQDADALRIQTRKIELHQDQISRIINDDAESCQAWFPLLREALFGSWGSMERVLRRDLEALLAWAGTHPRVGLKVRPGKDADDAWAIDFGPYRLDLPANAKMARSWRTYEAKGGFEARLLADEGGQRPDCESAAILHHDHPFIRDLAKRVVKHADPPLALAINSGLDRAHCLISVAFSVEQAGRVRNETRWFLLENRDGGWHCHSSRGSDARLRTVLEGAQGWRALEEAEAESLGPAILNALYDLQDQVELDVCRQRQAQAVRMARRTLRLWRPVVQYRLSQVYEAMGELRDVASLATVDPVGALALFRLEPGEGETGAEALERLVQSAKAKLARRQSLLKKAQARVESESLRLAQAEAELPSGIRVVVQDRKPNALVLVMPGKGAVPCGR